jgi:ATP-dependent DNA ligase
VSLQSSEAFGGLLLTTSTPERSTALTSVLAAAGAAIIVGFIDSSCIERSIQALQLMGRRICENALCKMGLEGIVSKRKDSIYRSGRSLDWLKSKNPACEAVRREAEEDWGK